MSDRLSLVSTVLGEPDSTSRGSVGRTDRRTHRVMLGLAGLLIPLFGAAYEVALGTAVDSLWMRLVLAAAALSVLGGSYLSLWIRDRMGRLVRVLLYVVVLWFAVLAALNDFSPAFALGSMWLWAAAMISFSVGLTRSAPMRLFMGIGSGILVAAAATTDPEVSPVLIVVFVLGLDTVIYPVVHWRMQSDRERERAYRRVEKAVRIVRMRHPEAEVTLVEESDLPAVVDANDLLGSVFENLVANGVRHNDRDRPTVRVTVEGDSAAVRVAVADDGPGISPEICETMFSEGERGLDSSGMGLGLYLVRTLLDLYEGDVELGVDEPRGTRFVVTLPRGSGSGDGSNERASNSQNDEVNA